MGCLGTFACLYIHHPELSFDSAALRIGEGLRAPVMGRSVLLQSTTLVHEDVCSLLCDCGKETFNGYRDGVIFCKEHE
jgi:hypothetical protein